MRIILDKNFRKRYIEIGNEFSFTFCLDIFYELFLFIIIVYVFGVLFFISLKDYPDFIKNQFLVIALIIIVFDVIFFGRINAKYLKDIKSNISLFGFPSIATFNKKRISFISNPMSSKIFLSFQLLFFIIIILLNKQK